ncbi:Immunoglobulin-like fold containing protein [Heracleum sosnowskyi]|uniref:Immunoglobulin-like fold containing protein n=1 Tax=Heracleum sosnowskyi TaxID=360622 RepID=A0AAD8M0T1_9APIA|nr:Immunoglobulin-like fold containing protein [Heracleum sosnowskyi]
MVEYKEQERPLASHSHPITIPNDTSMLPSTDDVEKTRLRRRCVKCCGCTSAVIVIAAIILLVLFSTVFKAKDPKINLNYVTIRGLQGVNPLNLVPNTNLTIIADVSVKNPNIASFKFKNATTDIYYENVLIGEAHIPEGNAKAKKTFEMKINLDFMLQKIVGVPRLVGDLTTGSLLLTTTTSIRGRVEIIDIIRKTVGVKMDCSSTVIIADQTVQNHKCTKYVKV